VVVSMYRTLLGDFGDRADFGQFASGEGVPEPTLQDGLLVAIFVGYTLIGLVLMLNILIAVVSDSYEYATICSRPLFLQARVSLVAELDVMGLSGNEGNSRAARFNQWFGQGKGTGEADEAAGGADDNDKVGGSAKSPTVSRAKQQVTKLSSKILRGPIGWVLDLMAYALQVSQHYGTDEDDQELWLGRALDMERRVEKQVRTHMELMEGRLKGLMEKHDARITMQMDKMEALMRGGESRASKA